MDVRKVLFCRLLLKWGSSDSSLWLHDPAGQTVLRLFFMLAFVLSECSMKRVCRLQSHRRMVGKRVNHRSH